MKYNDLISSTGASTTSTFDSDFFSNNLYASIVGCQSNNVTYCEKLGNLCVLQMYDRTSVACAAYINIAKSRPILSSSLFDR